MLAERTTDIILGIMEKIEFGSIEITRPCGRTQKFIGNKPGANAELRLHDYKVLQNMLIKGDIALAADYQAGKWDSNSISELILFGIQNEASLKKLIFGNKTQQILAKISYLLQANTKSGSKKNIHAHYDVGNDFYELWLDPTMTYSSALFANDSANLEQAQINKYDQILAQIKTQSANILEIGCGWGGFAELCAQTTKHKLTGITVSNEQYNYAVQRLEKYPIDLELIDYRDVIGQYDAIVSIEMFEAVGEQYWPTYFSKIKQLLSPEGTAIIQTITIGDQYFAEYRKSGDAIRSYIFPGGMLPSPQQFKLQAEAAGLRIQKRNCFGKDYARTLEHWLANFDAKLPEIKQLGFDEAFVRLWRFYLEYCIGAFKANRTDVMQVTLVHA